MPLRTTIIVPASDEADRIAGTIRHLPDGHRLIVVDDGSRDATAAVARDFGAEVLSCGEPGRPAGKGRAMLTGLSHSRRYGSDAVLLADADLGPSAGNLGGLIEALENGSSVVIAAFPPAAGGGFGLVKRYARRRMQARTGYAPREPLSGQRALLTPVLDTLPGIAPGYGAEVGMTLDLLLAGIEPTEIPLPLNHRPTGRTLAGFVHRARQGRDILKALNGERLPWP
ncbi:MAG: glycosyltransferase [Rubrobacteraceae bacterium]